MHGYVVCINFLVLDLLSNVYTSTPRSRAFPILIPNLYQQHPVGIALPYILGPDASTEKFPFYIYHTLSLSHCLMAWHVIVGQGPIYAPVVNYSSSCAVRLVQAQS
jgi:hypothetical protein